MQNAGFTRFECWMRRGLPRGLAKNMGGRFANFGGDFVWPIVDRETCGAIDGYPNPDQMLCWCPSAEKQRLVCDVLNMANQLVKPTDEVEVSKSYDVVIRCESQDSARRQLQWLEYYSIDAEIVEREDHRRT